MRTAKQTAEAAGSNPAPPSTGAYAGSYLLFLFSDSRERPARRAHPAVIWSGKHSETVSFLSFSRQKAVQIGLAPPKISQERRRAASLR